VADPTLVNSGIFAGDASIAFACTLAWTPTVGNYLAIAITSSASANPASAAIDDNQGGSNSYTKEATTSDATNGTAQVWWSKVVASSGSWTVNIKNQVSAGSGVVIAEYSNVHASSPILASGVAAVTTFTETLCLSKLFSVNQINAMMFMAVMNSGSGHTYTYRGILSKVQDRNTVGAGNIIGCGGGKLSAHGSLVGTIQIEAGDAYATATLIFKGADPIVTGPGGGGFDDRIRVERSGISGNGTGASWTMFRSRWVESTRDGGAQDQLADNYTRLN
jgi:hypothetical protein